MKETNINNTKPKANVKDIVLLFSVPISIAIIATLLVYVPSLLANPKYDFIYSACKAYSCNHRYANDKNSSIYYDYGAFTNSNSSVSSELKYYNAENDSTRATTLEEVQGLSLNVSSKSPDGYTLKKSESGGGFLFWDNYDDNWYLKNGLAKKKITLTNAPSYYSNNIKFLGWVIDEE